MSHRNLIYTTSAGAMMSLMAAIPAHAGGPVFLSDVVVDGSLCVGVDCPAAPAFGSDTQRFQENNLRVHFQDTSSSASFPTNDWRIQINDSSNGGANYFAVQDVDANRFPFRIEAGARANALYVEDDGDVGIGTSNPVVNLHVAEGNTPTLRLEQDGSQGFTPQTWDLAGNESNFFVRDVTNGSGLPFRIEPDALYVDSTANIGMGTNNPAAALEINNNSSEALEISGNGLKLVRFSSNDGNAVQIRMQSDSTDNRRILATDSDGTTQRSQISLNNNEILLAGPTVSGGDRWAEVSASGIELPAGAAFSVNGTNLNVPDYVFAPDYELMPLAEVGAFIIANNHLPNVPSATEINTGSLNMTAMQMTLLKKVEELTLYTLAQEAKIEALEGQVEALTIE
ncbi:hypothetical protein AIOL_003562 [Candidatus Rhodobacter oscarellae]|uniref:Uncharacterized protein n=1 Tax=Candidatus Rhodobacter oscarellae TaxID=1675527 RepID=A0A0J9EA92_9RHOB|nr:hypothetical protein [Candidatus Rhodobacter lobularis]KMW58584.1 hypothetical protein AIOL_003562 [Candidatus Rhodobacter lobularis]